MCGSGCLGEDEKRCIRDASYMSTKPPPREVTLLGIWRILGSIHQQFANFSQQPCIIEVGIFFAKVCKLLNWERSRCMFIPEDSYATSWQRGCW